MKVPAAYLNYEIVFPHTAPRKGNYTCIACKHVVYLKRGKILRAHFAHAPKSICTESIEHFATKHWIAKQVKNPKFSILSKCYSCFKLHTVLSGDEMLSAVTETRLCTSKPYIMDVAVHKNSRLVGCVEIFHTHRAGQQKLNAIE